MERLTEIIETLEFYKGETLNKSDKEDIGKAIKILIDYKDAEELGLLLRLPCKVGDTVWWINSCYTFNGVKRVDEEIVKSFVFDEDGLTIVMSGIAMGEFGKSVFLTKEEAEQRLKEMESE